MSHLMLVNPRKRRKTRRKKRAVSRRRTSVTRYRPKRRVRRRRNPIRKGMMDNIFESFKDGAIGSVGGIAASVVGGALPIPENFKTGNMAPVVQALIGIGTGALVGNFMNKKVGEKMATGAVTIALHGTFKNLVGQFAPNLTLGDYDDGLLGAYDDGLLGAYDTDDLGYYGAGAVADDMSDDSDDSGMAAYVHEGY